MVDERTHEQRLHDEHLVRCQKVEDLPVELQKKEVLTDRKPISTFAFEGRFKT